MTEWLKYVCSEHGVVRLRKKEHYEHDLRMGSPKCNKCGTPVTAKPAPQVTALSNYLEIYGKKLPKLSWPEKCSLRDLTTELYRGLHPQLRPSGKGKEARRICMLATGYTRGTWWIDHSDIDGDTFIAEPYNLGASELKAIIALVEDHDLDVAVSGRSWWYPGETLRITLKKKVTGE